MKVIYKLRRGLKSWLVLELDIHPILEPSHAITTVKIQTKARMPNTGMAKGTYCQLSESWVGLSSGELNEISTNTELTNAPTDTRPPKNAPRVKARFGRKAPSSTSSTTCVDQQAVRT